MSGNENAKWRTAGAFSVCEEVAGRFDECTESVPTAPRYEQNYPHQACEPGSDLGDPSDREASSRNAGLIVDID